MSYICGHIGINSKHIANLIADNSFSKVYQHLYKQKRADINSCYEDGYTAYACNSLEHSSEAFITENGEMILAFEGNLFQIARQEYFRSIINMVKQHERGQKDYLAGDYVFVLYKKTTKELRIYRSAMGARPIYYRIDGNGVSFASNLEQLVPVAHASMYISESSLKEYIANYLSWNSTGRISVTPYRNVYNLLPGMCLVYSHMKYHIWEYWIPSNLSTVLHKCSYNELQEELRSRLETSIKNKLARSMRAILQLSGGVDSSVLACVLYDMKKRGEINIPISFEHRVYQARGDERYYIKKIQEHVGDVFDVHFLYAQEEQNAKFDISLNHGLLPTTASFYSMCEDRSENNQCQFSTYITGCGADQVFSGDYSFVSTYLKHFSVVKTRRFVHQYSKATDIEKNVFFYKYALSPLIKKENNTNSQMSSFSTYLTPEFRKYIKNLNSKNSLQHVFFDISAQLDYENLLVYDQWINSTSIFDVVHPYLDTSIIELILSIPGEYRMGTIYNKAILRDAMKELVPLEVLFRKQKGDHNASTQSHIQRGLDNIECEIKNNLLYELGVVSESCISDLLYRLRKGITLNMYNATRIISLEMWLENLWHLNANLCC